MIFDEKLAEIVGIHFGDGSLQTTYNYTYKITYCLDSRNPQYVEHVKKLFFEVLAIQLKQYKVKNRQAVVTYFNSKKVCEELLAIGIPVSPKKNLIVPEWIMNKSSFTASFLKGLFDTDGCITRQKQGKYSYTLYKFTMKEKGFAKQVHTCLNKLRIDSFVCFKGANNPAFEVVVRKKKSIEEFDKLIQSEKGKIKTGA